jgi:polyisoprenoid-binding protein YceI
MKRSFLSLGAIVAASAALTFSFAPSTFAQALSVKAKGTKTITLNDKVGKNQFEWSSEAPLEKIVGTSEGVQGTLTLDPSNIKTLRGSISTEVATMKSGNAMRDEHIRGEAWLDDAKFKTISFKAISVDNVKANGAMTDATVTGDFTMHGVTKRMAVPVTLNYVDQSDKTRERANGDLVMLTAKFDVALKDFNVSGSKGVVGNKVGEKIQVTAKLFGSTAAN